MFVTLDSNCVIALENGEEPNAAAMRKLAQECRKRGHTLAVYSYLWLENRPFNSEGHEVANFPKRIEALGLGPIETLNPSMNTPLIEWANSVLFPNMPYSWYDYLADECAKAGISPEAMEEANRDHYPFRFPASPAEAAIPLPETLAPAEKENLRAFWAKRSKKWNNTRSDVLALCAHIMWARDGIFVTADEDDFIRNRDKLQTVITPLRIMTPEEALREVTKGDE